MKCALQSGMARRLICMLCLAVILGPLGCETMTGEESMIQIEMTDEQQQLVTRIVARRAGWGLAKWQPEFARMAAKLARAYLGAADAGVLSNLIGMLAKQEIKDPMLAADVADLLEILEINIPSAGPVVGPLDPETTRLALESFAWGVEAGL